MNLINISICCLIYLVMIIESLPINNLPPALINEFEQTDKWYRFKYAVGDGTIREEFGEFKTNDGVEKPLTVRGYYSYYLDDDSLLTVSYKADENGFHVTPNITKQDIEQFISKNALLSLVG